LPNRRWNRPETPLVKTSAVCTLALAMAGGSPRLRRKAVETVP
jgi:hypothetical protein